MKKFLGYFATFFAGILAVLAFIYQKPRTPIDPKFEDLKTPKKKEIKEIDKKIEKIEKEGVDKKKEEEVIDYWNKN